MKIVDIICSPGRTGFYFDDQRAIKQGAGHDGVFYVGEPVTDGLKEAVLPFDKFPEVDPVLGPEMRSTGEVKDLLEGETLTECLEALRKKMDFVIIDTSPVSVSADAVSVSAHADKIMLVVRTDTVAVQDINDAILSIRDSGGKLEGCILNDVYKEFTLFGQMGTDESGYYRSGYTYRRQPSQNEDASEGGYEASN